MKKNLIKYIFYLISKLKYNIINYSYIYIKYIDHLFMFMKIKSFKKIFIIHLINFLYFSITLINYKSFIYHFINFLLFI
jgi:hypothetical protein